MIVLYNCYITVYITVLSMLYNSYNSYNITAI